MRAHGAALVRRLAPGDVVLFHGALGAGKTTFIRGMLHELGVLDPVRSPTFNLIQVFDSTPPVMHADLYRLTGYAGIGLEDYLDTHICLIEWADRADGLVDVDEAWVVEIEFADSGRSVFLHAPTCNAGVPPA